MALTNDELLARFAEQHYERHSISAARRLESHAVLRRLAAQLDGRTLVELTPSDLMSWQGAELKRIKPNTVRKNQIMVRSFVDWAHAAELMPFELTMRLKSVSNVRGASANPAPRPYKRAEIQRFRQELSEWLPLAPPSGRGSLMIRRYLRGQSSFSPVLRRHARRLQLEAQVSLALEEGLRRIEIFHAAIAEIHPDNAAVVVRTAKSEPGQYRDREVPWTMHSRQCVQDWLDFRALLVPGHNEPWLMLRPSDPLGRQGFLALEDCMGKRGPLPSLWNWHRFRHTFATERLRAGLPLEQLQYMMGHSKLEQTLAYAKIVSADVRAESNRTEAAFERALGLVA